MTSTYIKPANDAVFRMSKAELLHAAAGRGKAAKDAQAELDRRAANKAAKKQGGRS